MPWWDFFKLFTYAFEDDPLSKKAQQQQATGAGTSQDGAVPNIRGDGSFWGGGRGLVQLRDSNDFVDLSSVTSRMSRYKEYERLRNVAEIEQAMTVFADESCISGDTKIATPFYGYKTIRWLEKHKKDEPFLVYCWDFDKDDYTLGWAYDPRIVKRAKTLKVLLDNGSSFVVTPDHRILLRTGEWVYAGHISEGDELMPFYRERAQQHLTEVKTNQFPRIFSFKEGWKHERQFIDEWRTGKEDKRYAKVNQACRLIAEGATVRETAKIMGHDWPTIDKWMKKEGFSVKEMKRLAVKRDRLRVIGVQEWNEMEVYDLSVKKHENFCTDTTVMHNCQRNDDGHVFRIDVDSDEIKKELEFFFFHRGMLNMDREIWQMAKKLFIYGDIFLELVINADSPKDGVLKVAELPPDSMYRIETTKGKLIEFQQSKEGPDFQALTRAEVTKATEAELQQNTAIRFTANQIVHFRIGDDRKTFYPYGQSLIEPARGPAHQLRLMEDAMVVYRLTRAPERRVFYIDVGQLAPFRAEAFIERMKDQFRKKKVSTGKGGTSANAVEERWHAPAADEDYWLPIRPNSNTRIETLPGAQNLGEIDDALYFRNKLLTALGLPKNFFANDDPQATRITLSAQDVRFARMIERLQQHIEDGLLQLAERHLELRGFPEAAYDNLKIKMTPPSDWKELSRAEVVTNRINNANSLKGSLLLSDYDILTRWMQYTEDESQEMIARMKIQKLEDLKLQVMAQNPQLMGIGVPGDGENELGAEAGGPNPMLGPEGAPPGGPGGGAPPGPEGPQPPGPGGEMPGAPGPQPPDQQQGGGAPQTGGASALPDAEQEYIKKYDLEIEDYASQVDEEEIDYSEFD